MNRRRWCSVLACAALASASGCAWANRDNRPVWNAFEEHLVPEGGTAFALALPVTVPLGFGAILVDTFVAHPLQVVDDAVEDAGDLWRHLDWEKHYVTQAGFAPFRAAVTPVWGAFSFVGRVLFDVPPHGEAEREAERTEALRVAQWGAWLESVAAGEDREPPHLPARFEGRSRDDFVAAMQKAPPHGRIAVLRRAGDHPALSEAIDWNGALTDASPVVRYHALLGLPPSAKVRAEVLAALAADPEPAVRELAARRDAVPAVAKWRGWLRSVQAGEPTEVPGPAPAEGFARIAPEFATAVAKAPPLGRLVCLRAAQQHPALAAVVDWDAQLADPSATLRFGALQALPAERAVAAERVRALRTDADPAVRGLALRRWPQEP